MSAPAKKKKVEQPKLHGILGEFRNPKLCMM